MGNKGFQVLVGLVVIINLAILYVWWQRKDHSVTYSQSHPLSTDLQYGDDAPAFNFSTTLGQIVNSDSLRGKFILLLFFDPEDDRHWEIISYADLLLKAYQNKELVSVAIAKNNPINQIDLISTLTLPIVVDDWQLSIHELFHLKDCCGATLLIDPDGVIRFITPYIANSRLTREIVESRIKRRASNGS